jgi:hypothetical protein
MKLLSVTLSILQRLKLHTKHVATYDFSVISNRMESELRSNLIAVATAFAHAEQCGLSTVSRRCRNDSGFFHRLFDETKSFTVRTFDDVLQWFSDNWPPGTEWPASIARPSAPTIPSVDSTAHHAGAASRDPNSEIPESLPPVGGHRDPVVTPAPTGG